MAKLNIITLGSSKNYTNMVSLGLASATVDDVNKSITFTLSADGSQHTIHFDQPSDGVSVTGISDKGNGKFTLLFSDGSESDEIQTVSGIKGDKGDPFKYSDFTPEQLDALKGDDGFSPSAKIEKVGDTATITITDKDGTTTATIKDGQGGTGGSGEENIINSISVNGVNVVPDENKNVDITVPSIDGLAKTEDIPTKVSELTNDSGYLTEHQDISGKVDKVEGKSLISDTEIARLASVDNYDDTQVKTQIQAVANGLMDSVGYSADYKSIDIIAKNSEKKSIDVAPIISHASITELSDVDTTNKATGKALVYNATTSKHEYADVSGTDEKVKMDASTDAKYLGELLDNITISNENGELKVKKLDGQEVTITEINYLKGLTMNVMDLVNMFSNGGVKIINTPVATYAELLTLDKSSFIEGISYLVYVLADENHDNAKTTYLVDKDSETPTYFGFADSQRDFTTNPIDLATEITGKLGISNMDSDAIKALFTVDDTYKTETATNNAFSTHGAKSLYDELLLAIGNKANNSDLTAHKDDTDIHVSTEDRTKWDSAKTHADSVHAPSNAQENIIESVKVNNQEIIADENKAVNIDLTGYAEHDEIVGENLIPYPYAQPERTTNGITFTFADDGSVIANGTATENADFSVCVRTNFGTDKALMLKPGTYAITGCPEGGSDSTYRIQVQFGDKTELKYSLKADYGKGFVFEVTEEYAKYACQIQCHVQKGYTVTNLVFKPMLVIGNVLHDYQPYNLSREALRTDIDDVTKLASRVDNQFSTASGNSITVNDSVDGNIVELGVKGNSFQKSYSGKNLLNLDGFQGSSTVTVDKCDTENNSVIITFTESARYAQAFGKYFQLANGQKYTFSAICNSYPDNIILSIQVYKAIDTTFITNYIIPKTDNFITFTASSEYKYRLLVQSQSDTALSTTCEFSNIQLELGDTATEYEPYVGGIPAPNPLYPQAINSVGDDGSLVVKSCGKNLIPYPYYDGVRTNVGLTTTPLPNGMVSVSGTNTGKGALFNFNYPTNASSLIKLDPNKTYAFFNPLKTDANNQIVLGVRWYLEGQELSTVTGTNTNIIYNGDSNGAIIKSGFSYAYVYLYAYASGKTFNDVLFAPMLVEVNEDGTYPTEYEIYKTSTTTIPLSEPLRAIGDVKDEITYQDGKCGVLRRTGKYIVDGTESWVLDSGNITEYGISIRLKNYTDIFNGIKIVSGNHLDMITDYLRCREFTFSPIYSASSKYDFGSGIYRTGNNIWIAFGASDIEKMEITKDLDSVKTWLSSHNITVHYPLGTPTFEPFADQTLPYLSTYDGVTNISNGDALSAEMTVKYPTTDASGAGSRNESRIAELDKNKVDKSSITTTLNSSSTDTQVPSAKVVYDNCISGQIKDYYVCLRSNTDMSNFGIADISTLTSLLDLTKGLGYNKRFTIQVNVAVKDTLFNSNVTPINDAGLLVITSQAARGSATYITYEGKVYVSSTDDSTKSDWTTWKRVCTTTVADVAKTDITFSDETKYSIVNNNCMYFVKNGICTMQIYVTCNTPVGAWATVSTDLPKPSGFPSYGMLSNPTGNECVNYVVNTSGVLQLKNGTTGINYIGTFSYPVAES